MALAVSTNLQGSVVFRGTGTGVAAVGTTLPVTVGRSPVVSDVRGPPDAGWPSASNASRAADTSEDL
jgi:hypothetical protein